jgi:hypothetical protein
MRCTERTPGSSGAGYESLPLLALCQSKILPTNGEMRVAFAFAQATACSSLQLAACMPPSLTLYVECQECWCLPCSKHGSSQSRTMNRLSQGPGCQSKARGVKARPGVSKQGPGCQSKARGVKARPGVSKQGQGCQSKARGVKARPGVSKQGPGFKARRGQPMMHDIAALLPKKTSCCVTDAYQAWLQVQWLTSFDCPQNQFKLDLAQSLFR